LITAVLWVERIVSLAQANTFMTIVKLLVLTADICSKLTLANAFCVVFICSNLTAVILTSSKTVSNTLAIAFCVIGVYVTAINRIERIILRSADTFM